MTNEAPPREGPMRLFFHPREQRLDAGDALPALPRYPGFVGRAGQHRLRNRPPRHPSLHYARRRPGDGEGRHHGPHRLQPGGTHSGARVARWTQDDSVRSDRGLSRGVDRPARAPLDAARRPMAPRPDAPHHVDRRRRHPALPEHSLHHPGDRRVGHGEGTAHRAPVAPAFHSPRVRRAGGRSFASAREGMQ